MTDSHALSHARHERKRAARRKQVNNNLRKIQQAHPDSTYKRMPNQSLAQRIKSPSTNNKESR